MDQCTQENRRSLYFFLHLCFSIKRAFLTLVNLDVFLRKPSYRDTVAVRDFVKIEIEVTSIQFTVFANRQFKLLKFSRILRKGRNSDLPV